MKIKNKWWGVGSGGGRVGSQGGCERKIDVFVEVQKNVFFLGGAVGGGGGQGRYERFCENSMKIGGRGSD